MVQTRRRGGRRREEEEEDADAESTTSEGTESNANTTTASVASSTTSTATTATDVTRSGLSAEVKSEITEFVKECLDDCQRFTAHQRKGLYKTFRKRFYKDRSTATANDYQKYFAQTMWMFSVPFFKAANSQPVSSGLKFIQYTFLNAGTPNDKLEEGCKLDTPPLYYYVLKLYLQCHMDERPLVRFRLISLAHAIISQYSNVAPIAGNAGMKHQLVQCFLERLKDRYAPVRALAVASLALYIDSEKEVLRRLKYFARFDPSPEVRKAVLAAVSNLNLMKSAFFYDFVFDSDAKVRVEAFNGLAARPFISLKAGEACKALVWGLSHDDKSKTVVVAKLLPAWMERCNNSPIEFLKYLGIVRKPSVVETVMNGIYLNNFTDTFDTIDLSFLNEEKLIPIENLSLESVMFWLYLIKKFGNTRHNANKMLPNAEIMLDYLQMVIEAIHTEHRNARRDDRDEDGTLLICMTYIVPIVLAIGLEEANRRRMGEILRQILLDPVMDEAPVIKMGVDALFKILDKREFGEKMMEIFQAVFEPDQTLMDQSVEGTTPRRRTGSEGRRSKTNSVERVIPPRSSRSPDINADEAEVETPMDIVNEEVAGVSRNDNNKTPASRPPTQGSRRVLTAKEVMALKDKLCKLALERLHLGEEKTNAIKSDDYLKAHCIQQKIDNLLTEEKATRGRLELTNGTIASMSDFSNVSSVKSSQRTNETSMMEMENVEMEDVMENDDASPTSKSNATIRGATSNSASKGVQDFPCSQGTVAGGDRIGISMHNILKGVLMMNRVLSCRPKIMPFVRQFYELYALTHFTDDLNDTQTRIELLSFLCLVGMIDAEEKRKIMGLTITALEHDTDPEIKNAAFKCMVDLLCRYNVEQFRYTGDANNDQTYSCAPPDFNNADAGLNQLQAMFVSIIDRFPKSDVNTPDSESVKAIGIIRLLTADRITSEFVVTDVLCMWCNPAYDGTKIPYDIGIWLPIYTKMSSHNARLVGKALFHSVVRIANANDRNLQGVDILKLVDFVLPFLSNVHLKPREDEDMHIHADLYEDIIDHVLHFTRQTVNLDLVQILPKLLVTSEPKAKHIIEQIGHVLLKLAAMPPTSTVTTLKTSLKKAGKRIASGFEELQEQLMEILRKMDEMDHNNDTSEDEVSDNPDVFSDDED